MQEDKNMLLINHGPCIERQIPFPKCFECYLNQYNRVVVGSPYFESYIGINMSIFIANQQYSTFRWLKIEHWLFVILMFVKTRIFVSIDKINQSQVQSLYMDI